MMSSTRPQAKRKASQVARNDQDLIALPASIEKMRLQGCAPYDASAEELPSIIIRSKELEKFSTIACDIRESLVKPLREHRGGDPYVNRLIEKIDKNLRPTREPMLLGVSGTLGTGKSSSLNSIHSKGKIAHTGDGLLSVTLVPTYYKKMIENQSCAIFIEIFFLETESIERMLREHVRLFYVGEHAAAVDAEDDDDRPEFGTAPEQRANISAMLYGLLEKAARWSSRDAARILLKSAQSQDDSTVIDQLIKWASKVRDEEFANAPPEARSVTIEVHDIKDLQKKVGRYTSDARSSDIALWPLVSHVDYHLDTALSKYGIMMLDAPGNGDIPIRAESAATHIRNCTHALIVTETKRACSEALFEQVKRMGDGREDRIIIAATKSDTVSADTDLDGSDEDHEELETLVETREKLVAMRDDFRSQCQDLRRAKGDREKLHDLEEQLQILEEQLQKVKKAELWKRVSMRNASAQVELQELVKEHARFERDIPIHCISNLHYARHVAGFNEYDVPELDVEQTGIPDLRRVILEQTVNPSVLRQTIHLYKHGVQAAIVAVRHHASTPAYQRFEDVRKSISKPQDESKKLIKNFKSRVLKDLREGIIDKCRAELPKWNAGAKKLCARWEEKQNARGFLSMMQHNGVRIMKKDPISISAEMQDINAKAVGKMFVDTPAFRTHSGKLVEQLEELMDKMIAELKALETDQGIDLKETRDLVEQEQEVFYEIVNEVGVDFDASIIQIKTRATRGEVDTFVAEALRPIYREVGGMKSTQMKLPAAYRKEGWGKYRSSELAQKVTDSCWNKAVAAMDKAIGAAVREMGKKLQARVTGTLEALLQIFNDKVNAKEASKEELQMYKRLLDSADAAEMKCKAMKPLVEELQRKFGGGKGVEVGEHTTTVAERRAARGAQASVAASVQGVNSSAPVMANGATVV